MPGTFDLVTHVILAPTPLAACGHMARHHHSFSDPERLWFFCYGSLPSGVQIATLLPNLRKKKIILLYQDDLLGRIAAIKIACWLKSRDAKISYQIRETVHIHLSGKTYQFYEPELSLSCFEKRTGLRSGIKTYKVVI